MKMTSFVKLMGLALFMGLVIADEPIFYSSQFEYSNTQTNFNIHTLQICTPNEITLTPNQSLVFYVWNIPGNASLEIDTLVNSIPTANGSTINFQPVHKNQSSIISENSIVITEDVSITSFESPYYKCTYYHNIARTCNIQELNMSLTW